MKASPKRRFKTWQFAVVCVLAAATLGMLSTGRSHAQSGTTYTITDLGTLGGTPNQSRGYGINNAGDIVGDSVSSSGFNHPFFRKTGTSTLIDMGTFGSSFSGVAYSVNSLGGAVGYSEFSGGQRGFFWRDVNGNGVSDPGDLQDFFPMNAIGTAQDVNDSGRVVGLIDQSGGNNLAEVAYYWDAAGGLINLNGSRAMGINNAGSIALWAQVSLPPYAPTHAFILKNANYIDLGTLDPGNPARSSFAWRISEDNHVVGYSQTPSNNASIPIHPFIWFDANGNNTSDAGEMLDLGTLSGTNSYAYDINETRYVIGTSEVTAGGTHAFIWHDDDADGVNDPGELKDLNTLVPTLSTDGWSTLQEARAINDGGKIVGWGTKTNGETHAFLLTPSSLPSTAISGVSGSGTYGGTAALTATLMSGGVPLNGKTISFSVNGSSVCGGISQPACPTTNISGVATLSGVGLSGISAATYPSAVGANFGGNVNYTSSSGLGTLTVSKATPTITWNNPVNIVYGTALSGTQLNATASVPGSFIYTPLANTVLNAGNGQTLHVDFTPTDSTNYTTASKNVLINVTKATPVIDWSNPADITYGAALSLTQLNATATNPVNSSGVSGSFTYTPAAGAVLHAGNGQTLRADFAPTDTANYNTPAQKTVSINVLKTTLTITADNKVKFVGNPNPPLTFTPTGFVNGDIASVLTGAPALSTTATNNSPVGNYPITITQGTLAAADYAFIFVNGTLSVTEPAPVLLLETGTNNAAAVDSVTFVRGPFRVVDNFNFSSDHLTRIIIFTSLLNQPDSTLMVRASGIDLPIENVGTVSGVTGLSASYIVVKLPQGLQPNSYALTVTLRGVTSNSATLTIIP